MWIIKSPGSSGSVWDCLGVFRSAWSIAECPGVPWSLLECVEYAEFPEHCEVPWSSLEDCGVRGAHRVPWRAGSTAEYVGVCGVRGVPWSATKCCGVPGSAADYVDRAEYMKYLGVSWRSWSTMEYLGVCGVRGVRRMLWSTQSAVECPGVSQSAEECAWARRGARRVLNALRIT